MRLLLELIVFVEGFDVEDEREEIFRKIFGFLVWWVVFFIDR